MSLSVISPYTHLNGHYWPYTYDLIRALTSEAVPHDVFASREPRHLPFDGSKFPDWHSCASWASLILSDHYRAKHWGSRPESLVRNLEFYLCLRAANARNPKNLHIHCIESRHRILLNQVIQSSATTYSTLCVGDPSPHLTHSFKDLYRRAFDTGRLTFIVETEAVREAWGDLAGEQVTHIPAALPWETHHPKPQTEARERLNLPQDQTICLFFGTHREGKDYETAIRAAKQSASQPYLLFVGPLISGNDPELLAHSMGYQNFESRSGYLPDDLVSLVFDAADVVMLPYADHYTKGSAVLLQACHFRKPVIATDTGHLKEFVELNHNGLLYTSRSIENLASAYDQIADLKTKHLLDDHWSFENAVSRYHWNNLIHDYKKIFFQDR